MPTHPNRIWLSVFASLTALALILPGAALAEQVQYVFETPSVADGEMSRKATAAVEGLTGVESVDADSMRNTLSVTFDDARLSVSDITSALSSVGCTVSTYKKK